MPYDLFISYSRRDNEKGRITQFVDQISKDFTTFASRELVPFFDQQEIHGMQDWRQKILQGLRESRLLIVCLSPAYLNSEYCEWEFIEYLKYEIGHLHGFNGVAPIYFIEVLGWDNKDFEKECVEWVAELRKRQHFDLRPWYDQGADALREADVQERMGKLNHQIADIITRGELAETSLGNVDAHNPHFIGRTANLRMLRENFLKPGHIGVVTAVNGLGGLGKTALAIEYAHAFADKYGGGRWQVRCTGKNDLRLALAELATPIGYEFTEDEKKSLDLQFERTRRELKNLADARAPHRVLLLLDNVDRPGLLDPAQVARLNGGDWLHVLATTRLGENELHGAHRDRSFLSIEELPSDDALALIESYQPDGSFRSETDRDAARAIVRLLGSFTLAVESAAVYLGQFANDVTCIAFLARLKKEGLEGLDTAANQSSEGVLHGEKRLSATLQPTLERLGAAEKMTLEFAALLPPDQVPLPWLRALAVKTFPGMERDAEPGYPDPWKNVLRRLFSLRLIQATDIVDEDGQPHVVRVHRLIQELVLNRISSGERDGLQLAVEILIRERDAVLNKTTNWTGIRWEIGPLTAVAFFWGETGHRLGPDLMNNVGLRWLKLAEWNNAEQLLRRALEIDETNLGRNHSNVARDLNNLAQVMEINGRYSEAEPLYRRALAIWKLTVGPSHPNIAKALNNIAALMVMSHRWDEAEALFREALEMDEQIFGNEDPEVARDLGNLAGLMEDQGRYQDADSLFRRALAIYEQAYGPDHPDVARSLGNLGKLLIRMGKNDEAERMLSHSIAINEKAFGQTHTSVATDLNDLSIILDAKGEYSKSYEFLQRALSINEQLTGNSSPRVAKSLSNLAVNLSRSGRHAEAETLLRRALAATEQHFGKTHPDMAHPLFNLFKVLEAQGKIEEAVEFANKALDVFRKTFGNLHPTTVAAAREIAIFLFNTKQADKVESVVSPIVLGLWPNIDINSSDMREMVLMLGRSCVERGNFVAAESVLNRLFEECERILGLENPITLVAGSNLATALIAKGDDEKAKPLCLKVLAAQEKIFGRDNQGTLQTAVALLGVFTNQKDMKSGQELMERFPSLRDMLIQMLFQQG